MARCPNYSQSTADAYVTALRSGAADSEAAAFVGVTEQTIRMWCRRRPEFAAKIDKVKADAVVNQMIRVRAAATGTKDEPGNWRASLILARQIAASRELTRLRELTTDAI